MIGFIISFLWGKYRLRLKVLSYFYYLGSCGFYLMELGVFYLKSEIFVRNLDLGNIRMFGFFFCGNIR